MATMNTPVLVGSGNWKGEVLQSDRPVVVDFFAPGCQVCQRMEPIVHRMANIYADQVKIALCNVAEAPDIAQELHVMASPTFVFYKRGQVVDTLVGYVDEEHMRSKLQEVLAA